MARNNKYLAEILLPTAILKFDEVSNGSTELLSELLHQLRSPPKPKPRSVYKTDVLWAPYNLYLCLIYCSVLRIALLLKTTFIFVWIKIMIFYSEEKTPNENYSWSQQNNALVRCRMSRHSVIVIWSSRTPSVHTFIVQHVQNINLQFNQLSYDFWQ